MNLFNGIRRLFGWKPPERNLLCMRLDEMYNVHPQQVESACSRCGAVVGIYPSGQGVLRAHPGTKIVCNHCGMDGGGPWEPAPGALGE